MKTIFSSLIVLSFFLSGIITPNAQSIEIYTFKKKRVDQQLKGNRGYISGTAPAPGPRDDKRTIIGIDIELPSIGGDDYEEEYVEETKNSSKQSSKAVTVVSDENWVK